jgi:1,4-alpha-glucan branching enzyme
MQAINAEIKQSQPWKIGIAEDMQGNEWLTKNTDAGGAGFDAQWEAQFAHSVRSAIITADDSAGNMYAVRDAISHGYNSDAFERVVYTESPSHRSTKAKKRASNNVDTRRVLGHHVDTKYLQGGYTT